jgi:UDP-N-acetylglucosamine:LPS N-acetylglucosamine transferase
MTKRAWLVLPDLLSIRVFFDTGIASGLHERLNGRLTAVFLVPRDAAAEWLDRVPGLAVTSGDELTAGNGLADRALARVDAMLDRQLGYHPLAMRLNHRHGFHAERMQPGHPNWMLDTNRDSRLPHRPSVDRAMERWFFSPRRHVPRRLLEAMRRECSGVVLSNVQPANAVPFLTAARRLSLPVVAHVASWDHTVGKGVISPHCDLYVVQNRVMEEDLRRYHGIEPERVRVTGWPQTDLFHRVRPRAEYDALLRLQGLDPGRPLVLVAGNTPSNAPYEGRFVERLVEWWETTSRDRLQLLFRPHPRDGRWRERFAAAAARDGIVVQAASYSDIEDLATLLQHTDVVVCNAGTILLDALVGDRPAVCVLYDEGAPPGESWAAKNVVGEHYQELAASGAFHRAERFEDVVAGIERSLAHPGELAAERRRAVAQVVGTVDGRAAERVVDAAVQILSRSGAAAGR